MIGKFHAATPESLRIKVAEPHRAQELGKYHIPQRKRAPCGGAEDLALNQLQDWISSPGHYNSW